MFPPRVTYLGAHHVGEPLPPSHLYDESMGLTTEDEGESWPFEKTDPAICDEIRGHDPRR